MLDSTRVRISLIVGVCCAFCIILPLAVMAQDLGIDLVGDAGDKAGFAAADETTVATTVGRAIRILLSMVGVVFTVLTVYAGILWMTARGNEGQVETAKKTLQNSIIGLMIAIGAYSITGFVIRAFESGTGGSGGGDGEITQCCMLCNRTGLSGACNFSTNEDLVVGIYQVPPSGRCRDIEDNVPACGGSAGGGDGRCVSRSQSGDGCADAIPAP